MKLSSNVIKASAALPAGAGEIASWELQSLGGARGASRREAQLAANQPAAVPFQQLVAQSSQAEKTLVQPQLPEAPTRDVFPPEVETWRPQDLVHLARDTQGGYTDRTSVRSPALSGIDNVPTARSTAQEILLDAQTQAQAILQQAQQQAQMVLAEARQKTNEVYEAARARGLDEARAEAGQLLSSVNLLIEQTYAWHETVLAQGEREMLDLVVEVGRKLFGAGVALDSENLQAAIDKAVYEAKNLGDLEIHLHPEDIAALDDLWAEKHARNEGRRFVLIPDTAIRRGGCLIEGQFGRLDARVESQLNAVARSLSEAAVADGEAV